MKQCSAVGCKSRETVKVVHGRFTFLFCPFHKDVPGHKVFVPLLVRRN